MEETEKIIWIDGAPAQPREGAGAQLGGQGQEGEEGAQHLDQVKQVCYSQDQENNFDRPINTPVCRCDIYTF